MFARPSASGLCGAAYTYKTSGNCIRRIGRTLMDWHCDGCDKEFKGLAISRFVRVDTSFGTAPGDVGLAVDCPECGAGAHPFTESFNTALTSDDERGGRNRMHFHRRQQAQLIRQLMRHGAVGLEALP